MPARRYAVAAVLALAALTTPACAADAGAEQEREDVADGEIDDVVDVAEFTDFAGAERNAAITGLVFDAAGSAVALVQPTQEDWHLVGVGPGDGGWSDVPLPATGHSRLVGLDPAPDGSVVVVTLQDGGFAVTRVAPDGEVDRVPVAQPADVNGTVFYESALSPDGATVYLAYVDSDAELSWLLAVDVGTGTLLATVRREAATRTEELQVTPSGEVLLAAQRELAPDVGTPLLERYDTLLQPLGTVPLLPGEAEGEVIDLAVDATETAYVSLLHDGGPGDERTFDIVAVEPGAAAAIRVATREVDSGSYASVTTDEGLAVTPDGRYAFQLDAPEPVPPPLGEGRVTAIDLTTGEDFDDIRLSRTGSGRTFALSPDGTRLLVGGLAAIDDFAGPVVWTLR